MRRRPQVRRAHVAAAVALSLALGSLVSCASDPGDPAQERRDRVESRLEATFSRQQAACIVEALAPETVARLDAGTSISSDDDALRNYSDALSACVNGLGGSPGAGG